MSTRRTGRTAELERVEYVDQRNGNTYWCPAVDSFTARVVTCKRKSCPRRGNRWALEWSEVTTHNLNAYNAPVSLVSITAPGADLLPWACTSAATRGLAQAQWS